MKNDKIQMLIAAPFLLLVTSFVSKVPAQDTRQGRIPAASENADDSRDREFEKGSKVGPITLTKEKIQALDLLGRVWGFVKYHHPAVAKGEYNWDFELFRVMPKYLEANTEEKPSHVLVEWIEGLGEFERRAEDNGASEIDYALRPDVRWIEGLASKRLAQLLNALKDAKRPRNHRYVDFSRGIRNPQFYEEPYAQFEYPDTGYRILALCRHWNIIQYYSPYRDLTDKNWNDVLTEFIPTFVDAGDALEYRMALMELVAAVQDTHAGLEARMKSSRASSV